MSAALIGLIGTTIKALSLILVVEGAVRMVKGEPWAFTTMAIGCVLVASFTWK